MKTKFKINIDFFNLLGIVFIILKLFDVINWNWLLVTLPIWGIYGVMILIIIFSILFKKFFRN